MRKTPRLVSKNKTLCKAVSLLPIKSQPLVPVAYIKALPMIVGAAVCLVLVAIPQTRNASVSFSEKTFDSFALKTNELKEEFAVSLTSGAAAYKEQINANIKILPIDTHVEPELYLGRFEKPKLFSERSHLMSASIYKGFEFLNNLR